MNVSESFINPHFANGSFSFPIHILPFGFTVILGGFVATFGNTMILLGMWKVEEFRKHKCNILICNLAVADLFSSLHFVVVGCLAVLGSLVDTKFLIMTNKQCFYICTSAILSFNAGSFMIMSVGVDRMVATACPIFYKVLPKYYTAFVILVSWMFGLVNFLLAFVYKNETILVPACILPTSLAGIAFEFWNKSNLLIVVVVVVTYSVAYKRLERPVTNVVGSAPLRDNQLYRRNKRLLNSLIVVVLIYVLSWAVTMFVIFLVTTLQAQFTVIFHASMYVGILANINVGCNFFIYYIRSEEYRKEVDKAFDWKPKSMLSENRNLLSDKIMTGNRSKT